MGHTPSLDLSEVNIGYPNCLVRDHMQGLAEFLGLSLFNCGAPSADEMMDLSSMGWGRRLVTISFLF